MLHWNQVRLTFFPQGSCFQTPLKVNVRITRLFLFFLPQCSLHSLPPSLTHTHPHTARIIPSHIAPPKKGLHLDAATGQIRGAAVVAQRPGPGPLLPHTQTHTHTHAAGVAPRPGLPLLRFTITVLFVFWHLRLLRLTKAQLY